MSSLRVYVVIPNWGLKDGLFDTNNFFINQALALKNAGLNPIVISVNLLSIRSSRVLWGYKIENDYEIDGVKIYIYDLFVPVPTVFNTIRDNYISLYYHKILKIHLKNDIESKKYKAFIIHAHVSHESAYYCLRTAKNEHIPIIVTEHYSGLLTGAASEYDYYRVKKTIELADRFIFVGSHFREGVCSKLNIRNKGLVIPNMVDKNRFAADVASNSKQDFLFLSAGTLKKNKSFNLVIEAFHNEFKKAENVKLLIAGEGVERNSLENLVSQLNEEERITFFGEYQKDDAGKLFSRSDAFVLTSEFETFGIVYVEALFCGLPCIGTKGQGADDIIDGNNGFLVPYGNVKELQSSMRYLFENIRTYNKNRIREEAISRFSEETITKLLVDVYTNELGVMR